MKWTTKSLTSFGLIGAVLLVLAAGCGGKESKTDVRLNDLQMIASHNSYHIQPPQSILDAVSSIINASPEEWSEYRNFVQGAEFTQDPIPSQLDRGVRNIEMDVYADTKGGLYAKRAAGKLLNQSFDQGVDQLGAPGFKVLHAPEVDFLSTCWTLKSCLNQVAAWSKANPDHLPLIIDIEAKDDAIPDPLKLGFAVPEKIGRSELDALDAEILSVFQRSDIITPDDIRDSRQTLEQAILKDGWPTIEKARGKVMFLLLDQGSKRTAYTEGRASLQGRVMFTTSTPGEADAAFVQVTDPTGEVANISKMVRAGYMVRTMADADTLEARAGNIARRDAAMASGAHLIATDFLAPIPKVGGDYRVTFAGGFYVQCNPVTARSSCAHLVTRAGE